MSNYSIINSIGILLFYIHLISIKTKQETMHQKSELLGLRLMYDNEFYTTMAGLIKEIQCLQPYKQSHASMSQHHKQLTSSLINLQEQFKHNQRSFFEKLTILDKQLSDQTHHKITNNQSLNQLMTYAYCLQQSTKSLKQNLTYMETIFGDKLDSRQQHMQTLDKYQTMISNISHELSLYKKQNNMLKNQLSFRNKQNQQLTSNHLPEVRKNLLTLLTNIKQLQIQSDKLEETNRTQRQMIKNKKHNIDQYTGVLLPGLYQTQKQEYMRKQELENKLGMFIDGNKLLESKRKVEKFNHDRLKEQEEIMREMLVKKNMETIKAEREVSEEITNVDQEKLHYQQNTKQLSHIRLFIQQLENTNMMMLTKMEEICNQYKQAIIEGLFANKCRKMAQMVGEVYLTTTTPSRKTGTVRKNEGSRVTVKNDSSGNKQLEKTGDSWMHNDTTITQNQSVNAV